MRDQSRLLVFNRHSDTVEHRRFVDLPFFLKPGDLLVRNNSRVIPARLFGTKPESGGQVELLLYEEIAPNQWWAMARPGKRLRPGSVIQLRDRSGHLVDRFAEIRDKNEEGHVCVSFSGEADLKDQLSEIGHMPLPPYIERTEGVSSADLERYQTVYATPPGSVAAPTAGLHFTPEIFQLLGDLGVRIAEVTLHVGLGTFAPVKTGRLEEHPMHEEAYELSPETVASIEETKARGGRVVAVGTTALRALESAANGNGKLTPGRKRTRLFVYPPREFKVVDCLLTNFHLPESTLLMLVSAFASPGETKGRDRMLSIYQEAIRERYRFFSYGDAMLIL